MAISSIGTPRGILLALCAASSTLAAPALASEVNYTQFELSWAASGDRDGVFSDGFALHGSLGVTDHVFISASLHAVDSDLQSGITTTATTIGAGLHLPLAPGLDLVTGASLHLRVRYEDDLDIGSARHDGAAVHAGIRARIVKYTDFGHGVHATLWSAGAHLYFTPLFAAGLDFTRDKDGDVWLAGLRFDIPNPD
jgi:hypothetical protein